MAMPTPEQERLLGLRNARVIRADPERLKAHRRGERVRENMLKREQLRAAMDRVDLMTGGRHG